MPGRSDYEERKQARIDRLNGAASKARQESDKQYQHSHDLVKDIPLGQPNIIGRPALPRLREKSFNALGKMDKTYNRRITRSTIRSETRAKSSLELTPRGCAE